MNSMNLLDLCDDLHESIGKQLKKNPTYLFKSVLQEIRDYKPKDPSLLLLELMYSEVPYLYACCYSWDQGGWWFEPINEREISYDNWVYKNFIDEQAEYAMDYHRLKFEDLDIPVLLPPDRC